jgi:membrane associated rhomboid family serine protease
VPLGFLVRWFGFVPAELLLRPWSPLTYMFLHGGFWHLLFNMLVVLFFGPPLEERLGGADFLALYGLSGLGGALLGFAFAFQTPVIGASAGVFGLLLAFARYWPDARIYLWGIFPVRARFLVAGLAIFTFIATFRDSMSSTAHFAHLGGLLAAALWLHLRHRRGEPFASPAAAAWRPVAPPRFPSPSDPRAPSPPPPPLWRRSVEPDQEIKTLDEVDRILDKISASGIGSLTEAERRTMDEVSRRQRSN